MTNTTLWWHAVESLQTSGDKLL